MKNTLELHEKVKGHFNFPAFIFSAIYLFFSGKKTVGAILFIFYLTSSITLPILSFALDAIIGHLIPAAGMFPYLIPFMINVYAGSIGTKSAWEHHNCSSSEEFNSKQKGWKIASIVVVSLYVVVALVLYN